jgi:2-polyprenyl-3-methyl-5-hydroxy-6-metoxy-1,4-benzoquinol methylase
VIFLLSLEAGFITGEFITLDGGIYKLNRFNRGRLMKIQERTLSKSDKLIPPTQCKLCRETDWIYICSIEMGGWTDTANQLERMVLEFPLAECKICNHVQCMRSLTETDINFLYFSNDDGPAIAFKTGKNEVDPYQQMVDAIIPFIKAQSRIADFGCGSGWLMSLIKQRTELSEQQLIGVDFPNDFPMKGFRFIPADLNQETSLDTLSEPVDIATASHVLEHVEDPIQFLSLIKHSLKPRGVLLVEVPDFSQNTSFNGLVFYNLVHGQHIHYFTAASLTALLERQGFEILETSHLKFRESSRLQVIAKLKASTNEISYLQCGKLEFSAKKGIELYKKQKRELRQKLYQTIKNVIHESGRVALWGVGGDCFQLFKHHSECYSLLEAEKIILFDRDHAGKKFVNTTIRDSSELAGLEYAIVHTPLFYRTRDSIEDYASRAGIKLLDAYSN